MTGLDLRVGVGARYASPQTRGALAPFVVGNIERVLARLRWFVYGLAAGVWGSAYVVLRVRRMRAALTPANVARATAFTVAEILDAAGQRVAPKPAPEARKLPGEH